METMKRVLVADDRANSRELIRAVLESDGYEVIEAVDGLAALEQIRGGKPDVVILDIQMPGLDGFGVIRELRDDAEFASLPAMALTANAMQTDRQKALDAGFDSYVSKPVKLAQLREEMSRLLGLRAGAG
jgi:CheY-like chemotaxis protein